MCRLDSWPNISSIWVNILGPLENNVFCTYYVMFHICQLGHISYQCFVCFSISYWERYIKICKQCYSSQHYIAESPKCYKPRETKRITIEEIIVTIHRYYDGVHRKSKVVYKYTIRMKNGKRANLRTKEAIQKAARGKRFLTYGGRNIRITSE